MDPIEVTKVETHALLNTWIVLSWSSGTWFIVCEGLEAKCREHIKYNPGNLFNLVHIQDSKRSNPRGMAWRGVAESLGKVFDTSAGLWINLVADSEQPSA